MHQLLEDLVGRIATRDHARSEATLQADIRQFILTANLNVDSADLVPEVHTVAMEAQVGDGSRRRIDVETGTTVIEVKKNLRSGGVLAEARKQLGSYVATRVRQMNARYLGVLTDGAEWILYVPDPDEEGGVIQAGEPLLISGPLDTEKLRSWLGAVLFTREQVTPTPDAIEERLGASSPAHHADHASLGALYEANRDRPTVDLKRQLWAKLLRTAFGSEFEDQERLFLDHTLLVLTAEAIAHAVVGFALEGPNAVSPIDLAGGRLFAGSQIHGVVESDFFDWVLEVDGGEEFVRSLASRIARFDWTKVEHDVLKHLYESVISAETRQALGEYYTPDWLTDRIIAQEYGKPLETRVLDASAGSGTFLFHAVRAYLEAAEEVGQDVRQAVDGVVRHVYGMDIHPVAVTLARVTYLLAIGTSRLSHSTRGKITIPVYLGDSIQWEQKRDLLAGEDSIVVETGGEGLISGGGGILFGENLVFPTSVLADAQNFDSLVSDMADEVIKNEFRPDTAKGRLMVNPILKRYNVPEEDWAVLQETFQTMRQLNHQGRNHIWGYYVRNLIRPLWLSLPDNRVDLLVGNPPWLRYSKMTETMQKRYLRLGRERNLLNGPSGASARDLSTLFVARAVELYLNKGGRFAYVMPHGTLTRKPHHSFRTGRWSANSKSVSGLAAAFDDSWELVKIQTGFPMVSCVIFGTKVAPDDAAPMPAETQYWTGKFSKPSQTWSQVESKTLMSEGRIIQHDPDDSAAVSPYIKKFRQGALVLPRMLVCVEETGAGPLGVGAGRIAVASRRGNLDKKPWSELPTISAAVGEEFVFNTYFGEHALPFRVKEPTRAVLPIRQGILLGPDVIHAEPDLNSWWGEAERLWSAHAKRGSVPLHERIDHHGQLSAQLGRATKFRVVYPKSGNRLVAGIVSDPRAIIDHSLYWAPVEGLAEARFLEAILNANCLLQRIKPLQTLGLFGSRHFDKYPFLIAFPAFNPADPQHMQLVQLAERAEALAATVDVSLATTFQNARKLIDNALGGDGVAADLELAVEALLPAVDVDALEGLVI